MLTTEGAVLHGSSFKLAEQLGTTLYTRSNLRSFRLGTDVTKDVFPDTSYFVILNGFIMPMVQMQILTQQNP